MTVLIFISYLFAIMQEYTGHKDLDEVGDCRFNSSIPDIANVYDFVNAYDMGQLPKQYYAFW